MNSITKPIQLLLKNTNNGGKKEDPGIQKFSIGDAIYYIKKKE